MLAEYSLRMEFVRWRQPDRVALSLRAMGRHIAALTKEHTRLKSRVHAAQGSTCTPRCVAEDLKRSADGVRKRIVKLRREAVTMGQQDAD